MDRDEIIDWMMRVGMGNFSLMRFGSEVTMMIALPLTKDGTRADEFLNIENDFLASELYRENQKS